MALPGAGEAQRGRFWGEEQDPRVSGEEGKLRSQIPVSEEPPFQSKSVKTFYKDFSVKKRDVYSAKPQHESFTKLGRMPPPTTSSPWTVTRGFLFSGII